MPDTDRIVLEVKDKGKGLPADFAEALRKGEWRMGVGIAGMRERVRMLGGTLEFETGAGGTTVRATVPILRPEE